MLAATSTAERLAMIGREPQVRAVVLDTSQLSRPFYERHGFRAVAETPDGYGPGLDRIDMRRGWARRPSPRPAPRTAGSARRSPARARRSSPARDSYSGVSATARILPTSVKSSCLQAARGERRRADPQPRGLHRRARVERHGVAVDRDADLVQAVLGLLAGQLGLAVAQVDEHQVHVGAAGEHVDAVAGAEQLGGERLRAGDRAALALGEQLARRRPSARRPWPRSRARAGRPAGRGTPPSRSSSRARPCRG